MPSYYISTKQLMFSNQHDMHVRACYYFSNNNEPIGEFNNCKSALETAIKLYPLWEIVPCEHCCQPCIDKSNNQRLFK